MSSLIPVEKWIDKIGSKEAHYHPELAPVVSLTQWKTNNPKEAELHFKKADGQDSCVLRISSPDGRTTYKHHKYDAMPHPEEFGNFIGGFKAKHPECKCIDF